MRWFAPAAVVAFAVVVACSSTGVPDRLIIQFDGGSDAASDVAAVAPSEDASGANPYAGGPCIDDLQCDDMIACTYDSCDKTVGRCMNVPDDTQCDDRVYCNGKERCVPRRGCQAGAVVSCSDGNACHIAQCLEASKSCAYTPRDVDQDGDPDRHCAGGHDCNDLDPNVSSLHPEVCSNGIDDNCNGVIDEMPCVTPQGDTCANAVSAPGAGTYILSTVGSSNTLSTSCSVTTPSAAENVVAAITVPPGSNADLDVWATTSGVEVACAIEAACGMPASELSCAAGTGATSVRARASRVAPGTYYAVVTTQSPTAVELKVDLLSPSPPPSNVDCATAAAIQPGTPLTVSIVDRPTVLPSACAPATGTRTYAFALTKAEDVRVYASTLQGSGSPVIGLRSPTCVGAIDELGCRSGSAAPIYARGLVPGTYVVTIGASSPIDARVDVEISPPTPAPPDQTCATAPIIAANATAHFDLSAHENAIKDGCFPGGPDAAYHVDLASASDVLLVERVPQSDEGALSFDPPACTSGLACSTVPGGGATSDRDGGSDGGAAGTPVRLGLRNVPAGPYRTIVADELGLPGTLDVLVRPTVAPVIVPAGGAETCAAAVDVSAGGFFTGDTSSANADYGNPCDAPTSPPGGAADQVLALNLPQPQRVVLDMEGSTYTTILDVRRQDTGCPGTPVSGACYVGAGAQRSFLDIELPAGRYWIIVDGYALAKGAWNLDVRVLPP